MTQPNQIFSEMFMRLAKKAYANECIETMLYCLDKAEEYRVKI
jgi:hypothetical protein